MEYGVQGQFKVYLTYNLVLQDIDPKMIAHHLSIWGEIRNAMYKSPWSCTFIREDNMKKFDLQIFVFDAID
jgi:hypothetical protein